MRLEAAAVAAARRKRMDIEETEPELKTRMQRRAYWMTSRCFTVRYAASASHKVDVNLFATSAAIL